MGVNAMTAQAAGGTGNTQAARSLSITVDRLSVETSMQIIESVHAVSWPRKPITDDMREMVEHFERLGLIRPRPAAYTTGRDVMVVHPFIMNQIRARVRARMGRVLDGVDWSKSAIFGGSK